MKNLIPRTLLCAGLALAMLSVVLPEPAAAENPHEQNYRPYARGRQQQNWNAQHRYDGYSRRPDVYYTAPPIVYQPYGYYQQPGAALILNFPFYR